MLFKNEQRFGVKIILALPALSPAGFRVSPVPGPASSRPHTHGRARAGGRAALPSKAAQKKARNEMREVEAEAIV